MDDYITQVSFPEETEALKMELSRSNSLFKFGDSRDALYNMLYYQFYVKRINLMPKDFLQYGCQCQASVPKRAAFSSAILTARLGALITF